MRYDIQERHGVQDNAPNRSFDQCLFGQSGADASQHRGHRPALSAAAPPPSDQASRDMYCRQSAAASTGYTTPGQAANRAQTNGTVGGLLGGAALGAIIGGRNAGAGAAIGAGVGALAGTAVGSANADRAAADVQRRYSDTYYACMNGAYGPPPPPGYYAPPPPPPGDYPPPPPGAYGPPPGDYPPPPDGPYPR